MKHFFVLIPALMGLTSCGHSRNELQPIVVARPNPMSPFSPEKTAVNYADVTTVLTGDAIVVGSVQPAVTYGATRYGPVHVVASTDQQKTSAEAGNNLQGPPGQTEDLAEITAIFRAYCTGQTMTATELDQLYASSLAPSPAGSKADCGIIQQ